MSSTHFFFLRHSLSAETDLVYANLADLCLFGKFHPHMKEVKARVGQETSTLEYDIFEELVILGLLKIKPRYSATVTAIEKNKHIRYTSQVKPFIFLQVDFEIEHTAQQQTLVSEKVQLTCFRPIALIFYSILKKAYLQVFANLQKHLRNEHE